MDANFAPDRPSESLQRLVCTVTGQGNSFRSGVCFKSRSVGGGGGGGGDQRDPCRRVFVCMTSVWCCSGVHPRMPSAPRHEVEEEEKKEKKEEQKRWAGVRWACQLSILATKPSASCMQSRPGADAISGVGRNFVIIGPQQRRAIIRSRPDREGRGALYSHLRPCREASALHLHAPIHGCPSSAHAYRNDPTAMPYAGDMVLVSPPPPAHAMTSSPPDSR